MPVCSKCGEDKKAQGFAMHVAACKGGGVAVMERPEPRSRRARTKYAEASPTPLQQIRQFPSGVIGPSCYYLRPGGATIRDVLIVSPNGGIPDMADEKLRGRYGRNADVYRSKAARKGFKYLGVKLDMNAVRAIVEEIAKNLPEEIAYMKDEIDDCEHQLATVENPGWRDVYRKKKARALARLETLTQDWDPERLVQELEEISQAQRLSKLDPEMLRVMREMVGDAKAESAQRIEALADAFRKGKGAEAPEGIRNLKQGGGDANEFGTSTAVFDE